jgi:hypothetical protein
MLKLNPLISICVLSWNNADFLNHCLEAINRELGTVDRELIEVVIADDGIREEAPVGGLSLECTYQIVTKQLGNNFRYTRNGEPHTQGIDRNVERACNFAQGEYAWMLGTDDILAVGGLATIVDCLLLHREIEIFFANYYGWNTGGRKWPDETQEMVLPPVCKNLSNEVVPMLQLFKEAREFYGKYCLIMRTQHFRNAFVGVNWSRENEDLRNNTPHIPYIIDHLLDKQGFRIGEPTIYAGYGAATWTTMKDYWMPGKTRAAIAQYLQEHVHV